MTAKPTGSSSPRYSFCPHHATPLVIRPGDENQPHPTCTTCGFVDYGNPKPCVAVLIVDAAGRVLLAQRLLDPAKGQWDIPGGFVEANEPVEETVRREVFEETGLSLTDIRYFASYPDVYGPDGVPTINLCFTARRSGGELRGGSDVANPDWFSPSELPQPLAFAHQQQVLDDWRAFSDRAKAGEGQRS